MNILNRIPTMLLPALALALVLASTGVQAHGPADEEKVVPLQMQKLSGVPGMLMNEGAQAQQPLPPQTP